MGTYRAVSERLRFWRTRAPKATSNAVRASGASALYANGRSK
jgi:hypothetical protein